jgi:hypothetical protein
VAGGGGRGDLGFGHSEQEEVLVPDQVADFHVRPVQGADGQGTVQGEFHVAGAGGLLAGQGDLFGQVGGRDHGLGQGDVVVGRERDP